MKIKELTDRLIFLMREAKTLPEEIKTKRSVWKEKHLQYSVKGKPLTLDEVDEIHRLKSEITLAENTSKRNQEDYKEIVKTIREFFREIDSEDALPGIIFNEEISPIDVKQHLLRRMGSKIYLDEVLIDNYDPTSWVGVLR